MKKNIFIKSLISLIFLSVSFVQANTISLPVQCEYPVKTSMAGDIVIDKYVNPMEVEGEIDESLGFKVYSLDSATTANLDYDCRYKSDYDPSLKAKPSLIARHDGWISTDRYPVASKDTITSYKEYIEGLGKIPTQRNPGDVFTIFFHGTGSNPVSDLENKIAFPPFDDAGGGELLSKLGAKMSESNAKEGIHFINIDGVGSGNRNITNLHDSFLRSKAYSFASGTLIGRGVNENTEHALLHLKGKTFNPANMEFMIENGRRLREIGTVLIVGWSRGAVTALNFAAKLFKDPELKDIKVHMFLIDPVPGLSNYPTGLWQDIGYLYPNVKSAQIHYARNERSYGFTPIFPEEVDEKGKLTGKNTNRKVFAWPGNHATLVGNILTSKDTKKGLKDMDMALVARMIRGLATNWLYHLGAPMSPEYAGRNDLDICPELIKDFKRLMKPGVMEKFRALEKESYTGFTQMLGNLRKYYVAWSSYDRGDESNLSGFSYINNFENLKISSKMIYVNKLHRLLEEGEIIDSDELVKNLP